MTHESIPWQAEVRLPSYEKLDHSVDTDVAIVGAGITGLTTAYLLAKAGYKVVIIDKKKIGDGATAATTAFLTEYIDTMMYELIAMFGKKNAQTIIFSHATAIDEIESIIRLEHIECDFHRCPLFIYTNTERELKTLEQERKAAQKLGVSLLQSDKDLGFPNAGYLTMNDQAEFHPIKYMAGLLAALSKQDVRIFEDTQAISIQEEHNKVTVHTKLGDITASYALVATYEPFDRELHYKKAFYDTYVQEVQLPHGALPIGIYEDTLDPYHYIRIDQTSDTYDRMFIGGEDHRSDIPVNHEKHFAAVEEYSKKILGSIPHTIMRKWKGPIIESIDGLAWIGAHTNKRIFYTTGFSGTGMTYSMIAAKIVTDSITNTPNAWAPLYDIDRVPTLIQLAYKGKDYTNELLGGAVKDFFTLAPK